MRRLRRGAIACAVALLATVAPARSLPLADETTLAPLPPLPPLSGDHTSVLLRDALRTAAKYYLNTWWTERMAGVEPYGSWTERLAAKGTLDAEEVRRFSSVALALAAPLASGAYDPGVAGTDVATAKRRVAELVGLAARTHRANVARQVGWGGSWQSALWASQAALAGWLVGDALPAPDRVLMARMLAYEADAVLARPMHYLRDRGGKVLTPGDSGAEELSWDALGVLTAVELLPHHPRRALWMETAVRRFVAAYSLPADLHSDRVVNGRPLSKWLNGSNLEKSGWVVNHHRLNPDYTVGFNVHAPLVAGLAGSRYPAAILHNQALLYRNISQTPFASPPYRAPGGTVYVRGTPRLYFPTGADWGTGRQFVFGVLDTEVAALRLDRGLRTPARTWATLHLREVRRLQNRFATGQMFGAQTEDRYFAREEHAGALLAYGHLTDLLARAGRLRVDHRDPSAKVPVPAGLDAPAGGR